MAGGAPVLAVVRGGRTLAYDDPACTVLQAGDRIVYVGSSAGGAAGEVATQPPQR